MNLLALLNLTLAMSTVNEAKSTAFFSGFHFEQTSSLNGVVTFEPVGPRYHGLVKLVVAVDDAGYIENTKLEIKRSFIDGAQSQLARNVAKSYLKEALTAEDVIQIGTLVREISVPRFSNKQSAGYATFLGKQAHFESRFSTGTMLTMDEDRGWLVIFAGHSDGPKIGLSFTSYKLKTVN